MQKLMVIDGNSLMNRAFYGLPILNAPDGTPTNAVLGFFNMILKISEEESPTGICVCFDLSEPTFRHKLYNDYKAGRHPTPPELKAQFPILKELLSLMHIPCLSVPGFEADDLLGTLSKTLTEAGSSCVLVTGDRDSMQLIGGGTILKYCTSQKGHPLTKTYDEFKFLLDYGVTPAQYPDVKALMGDPSDNIPGVKGIGEKTAFSLIAQYGSITNCYSQLESANISPSVQKKLSDGKADAYKSLDLVTIRRDVPLDINPTDIDTVPYDTQALYFRLKSLGLENLIKRLNLSDSNKIVSPQKSVINLKPVTEITDVSQIPVLKGSVGFAVDFDSYGFAITDNSVIYTFLPGPFSKDTFIDGLSKLFSENMSLSVIDSKAVYRSCLEENITLPHFDFDVNLAIDMCEAEGKDFAEKVSKFLTEDIPYTDPIIQQAETAYRLNLILLRELDIRGVTSLYRDTELPLALVLAKMEHKGFKVSQKGITDFGTELNKEIGQLETDIYKLAGERFNINSPGKLGEILFDKLGLPHGKKTQRGWSTNADVLNKISDVEIIQKILLYRSYTKLKSTYVEGLLKEIDSDGRIRTRFIQLGAATGRLSSQEPNLQNIPVRSEPGCRMRAFFTATEGNVLVDADYSQIELRILASEANDRVMIDAFAQGIDIHRTTAAKVFQIAPEEVSSKQRSFAKAVNFGMVYGISDFALGEDLGIPRKAAREMMDRYFETYSGIKDYMHRIVEDAKSKGYVTTRFNRRRTVPGLTSSNFNIRSAAERIVLNTPIQGTAADIIKKAMVAVDNRIKKEGLTGQLILQVHDELIVECPKNEAAKIKQILSEEMSGVIQYPVHLSVEVGTGDNWEQAKK